jgi:hypothetical protein
MLLDDLRERNIVGRGRDVLSAAAVGTDKAPRRVDSRFSLVIRHFADIRPDLAAPFFGQHPVVR